MKSKVLVLVILFALAAFGLHAAAAVDSCLKCHKDQGDDASKKYPTDIHSAKGITCAGCHGGDPTSDDMDTAMDPKKGFIGTPTGLGISDACLKCHADAGRMASFHSKIDTRPFTLFKKSAHGNPDIATCITCHSVHDTAATRDPRSPVYPTSEIGTCAKCHSDSKYMKQFNPGLPTDQQEKYETSMHAQRLHAGDLNAATCSSCHGKHDIFTPKDPNSHVNHLNVPKTCARCHSDVALMKPYGIPTDQYTRYVSSVHGVALLQKRDLGAPACNDCHGNHGALPPGVASIYHVCGSCHPFNMENFSQSPHAAAFKAKNLPQCTVCHSNHGIQPPADGFLNPGKGSMCGGCHPQGDKGSKAGEQLYALLSGLDNQEKKTDDILAIAERKGMDVSDARFKYKDIQETLIKARTTTHKASVSEVQKIIEPGMELARAVQLEGQAAIHEYSYRRMGLGISTLLITLLAIALYLKIRSIEGR